MQSFSGKIANNIGEAVSFDITIKENSNQNKLPIIFLLHGFKISKNWGFFPYLANKFADNGFIFCKFNFSTNGYTEASDKIIDFEKFARNTITQDLLDALLIFDSFNNKQLDIPGIFYERWNGEIYLLGFSKGGGIAILSANERSYVNKIALWSSIYTFDRYTNRQKQEWKKNGFIETRDFRNDMNIKIYSSYLEDLEQNINKYNLKQRIRDLKIPILALHCKQDFTVPVKEIYENIDFNYNKNVELYLINHCGHSLGTMFPYTNPGIILEEAISKTMDFYKK